MAEMLRDSDSSEKHLSASRRHQRLCRQVREAEFLIAAIEPHHSRLIATMAGKNQANDAEEDARDDLDAQGREAADTLRTASERAKQHDRDNLGSNAHSTIFPDGGFGPYLNSNGTPSAASCNVIATRIQSLGPSHPLATLGAELKTHGDALDTGQTNLESALRARKLAEAEDELAQAALRRAYEENWLDAQKKFGKAADRLFPRLRKRRSNDDEPEGG